MNHVLDSFGRQTHTRMSGVTRLSAGFTAAGSSRRSPGSAGRVGRWRQRGVARVGVEPSLQLADFRLKCFHPRLQVHHQFGQLSTLRTTGGNHRWRFTHTPMIGRNRRFAAGPERSPSMSILPLYSMNFFISYQFISASPIRHKSPPPCGCLYEGKRDRTFHSGYEPGHRIIRSLRRGYRCRGAV